MYVCLSSLFSTTKVLPVCMGARDCVHFSYMFEMEKRRNEWKKSENPAAFHGPRCIQNDVHSKTDEERTRVPLTAKSRRTFLSLFARTLPYWPVYRQNCMPIDTQYGGKRAREPPSTLILVQNWSYHNSIPPYSHENLFLSESHECVGMRAKKKIENKKKSRQQI